MRPYPAALATILLLTPGHSRQPVPSATPAQTALTTLAVRVRNMDAMVRFYSEAFGASFRPVDTFGLASQFGTLPGLTLKFVPIRDSVDFEGFPVHQPGFTVGDVRAVMALAVRYGGRPEGTVAVVDGRLHGAVRDPDGNTIELYAAD